MPKHEFVIVIPVADRPRHLSDCLASLLELRRRYPYDRDVSVLVADDSRDPGNLARHETLSRDYTRRGLTVNYLSQDEQQALPAALPAPLRARLSAVLGDGSTRFHKGASITRNIAYLWLKRLQGDGRRRLFWFLDSDQVFRVNVDTGDGEEQPYAIDYFHALDAIFSETPTQVLTGKVVGDPPVSPAVMAGTFLDDVLAFLVEIAALDPQASCCFHGPPGRNVSDAAYHDMADLFGFQPAADSYRYRCPLEGEHDHAACFADFAARLNHFFDGEHPTRRSYYEFRDLRETIKPARTLYTGNFVITPQALDWFIPFAALKLRMAGPALGRIIKAELGAHFVTANLPMLHRRTVEGLGQSECRPGVAREDRRVDLSGEFERQYFGDVMLFALERLAQLGYPSAPVDAAAIGQAVDRTEAEMQARYRVKHRQVGDRIAQLIARFHDPAHWWKRDARLSAARDRFQIFIGNMQANFTDHSPAWRRISSETHRARRKGELCRAIAGYPEDRVAWREALELA